MIFCHVRPGFSGVLIACCIFLSGFALSGCGKLEDEDPPSPTGYVVADEPFVPNDQHPPPTFQGDENAFIYESLKDGYTVGAISDGNLTPNGLQLHGDSGFIRYSIPTTSSGYVEFSASGFAHNELHGGTEFKAVLLSMWSGRDGYSYETAPFIFELRKYGLIEGRPDASNCFMFKIKSNGHWEQSPYYPMTWDSRTTYRIRIEWSGSQATAFRNGTIVGTGQYHGSFAPGNHQVQIGAQPLRGRKSPHDLLISDVIIGALQ